MSIRILTIALILVASGAMFAACTDDSERASEYQRDLSAVGATVAAALDQLPQDDAAAISPQQVRTLAKQLGSAADALEDLDPPDDAAKAQARFERGLRGVAEAFADLADDLDDAADDDARAEQFVQFADDRAVDRAFEDLGAAQDAFAAAGFRVFREPPAELEDVEVAAR